MLAFVARHDFNAQTVEHRAHRRIDVLIRARNLMTTRLQHPCERSHRRPTNPDQMVVHESIQYTLFDNLYSSSLCTKMRTGSRPRSGQDENSVCRACSTTMR